MSDTRSQEKDARTSVKVKRSDATPTLSEEAPPPAGKQRRNGATGDSAVTVISFVTAVCILGDAMLYVVLPVYWERFGLDALWQVGVLLSVNRFIRLPLNPLVGWLYHRMTMRAGVLAAVIIAAVTTWSYGFAHSFWVLVCMRGLWGAAWSMLRLGGYLTVLEASTDETRGRLLGKYNGLWGIGSLVGMLAGGMLADAVGIPAVCAALAAVTLAGIPYAWRCVPQRYAAGNAAQSQSAPRNSGSSNGDDAAALATANGRRSAEQPTSVPASRDGGSVQPIPSSHNRTVFAGLGAWRSQPEKAFRSRLLASYSRHREQAAVLATGILVAIVYFGLYLSTLSKIIEDHMAQPIGLLGFTFGAAALTGFVQALRWSWSPLLSPWIGRLSDGPQGRTPLFAGSLTLGAVAFALLPVDMPLAWWLPVLLAAQLGCTAVTTLMDAVASDTASRTSRVAFMTWYTTAIDVGSAVGPIVGYAAIQAWGLSGIYAVCAFVLLAMSILWMLPGCRKLKRDDAG